MAKKHLAQVLCLNLHLVLVGVEQLSELGDAVHQEEPTSEPEFLGYLLAGSSMVSSTSIMKKSCNDGLLIQSPDLPE